MKTGARLLTGRNTSVRTALACRIHFYSDKGVKWRSFSVGFWRWGRSRKGPPAAYLAPSAPLAGTSGLHRLAAYTRGLRCAYWHRPRRPTTGSELSSMLFATCRPLRPQGTPRLPIPSTSPKTLAFNAGLKVSAFPLSSHSDSGEGIYFRGFPTVRLRYDLLLGLPSCRSGPE
jgi:hypothetical protein